MYKLLCVVFLLLSICLMGCTSEYQYSSVSGVIIDVENRPGGNAVTVMFEDDSIHTFFNGKKTAYALYILCRNHINDSITIEYRVTGDVNVNLHNRFFIEDFWINPTKR